MDTTPLRIAVLFLKSPSDSPLLPSGRFLTHIPKQQLFDIFSIDGETYYMED